MSHGVINALLVCAAVGTVPAHMDQYPQPNGCAYRLYFRRRVLVTVECAPLAASFSDAVAPYFLRAVRDLMTPRRRAIVIAGPASGVGKTTIALGLMAAFRRRGLAVQPFKCGPDFIDAGHHTRVCDRPSRNLDGWMLSGETNRALFAQHASTADIAIVEGVMGLFDGARNSGEGSTAAMAKHLRLPVLLVVDASRMAASAAALVRGFETFDPAVRIAGVVFNQLGSAGHYGLLRDALEQAGCAPALGYLPKESSLRIPERHLGLYTAHEDVLSTTALDHLSSLMEQFVDLDRVLEIAAIEDVSDARPRSHREGEGAARIAVARDRAFCFYYEDNLDALRAAGAEIVEFSPLADRTLPDGTDALYIGGGYPELYAAELSANHSMRARYRTVRRERRPDVCRMRRPDVPRPPSPPARRRQPCRWSACCPLARC